jgi:hypothetical protein
VAGLAWKASRNFSKMLRFRENTSAFVALGGLMYRRGRFGGYLSLIGLSVMASMSHAYGLTCYQQNQVDTELAQGKIPSERTFGGVTCYVGYALGQPTNRWPAGRFWNCAGAVFPNPGVDAFNDLPQDAQSKLCNSTKTFNGSFYIFDTEEHYLTYCKASSGTSGEIPCLTHSLIHTGITNPYVGISIIFTTIQYISGGAIFTGHLTSPDILNTTAHEAGHQVDPLYGERTFGSSLASLSPLFVGNLDADWQRVNDVAACGPNETQDTNSWGTRITTGIFVGYKDLKNNEICSDYGDLNPIYAGLTNQEILQKIWPSIFSAKMEMWAEETAVSAFADDGYTGETDIADSMLGQYFPCSLILVAYLENYGKIPPPTATVNTGFGTFTYSKHPECPLGVQR